MEVGSLVTRDSTGESGVLIRIRGEFADVQFPDGRKSIALIDLSPTAGSPEEQLGSGVLHESDAFRIRLLAQYLTHAFKYDPLAGLTNARIEPLPHQVSVAHRVTSKYRPRMILADEVGLGKTIEAGLIIKESLARGSAERVLVICPASLQYQWQFELESKFNEEFEIINSQALKFFSREGANPWTRVDKAITSIHLARRSERIEEIVDAGWDLVVFDEAHRVRRKRDGGGSTTTTKAYELADELKEYVHGMLLLTATPMQLDPFEFYSLIELVEPGLFSSFNDYDRQRLEMPMLNEFAKGILDWPGLARDDRERLSATFPDLLVRIGIDPDGAGQILDSDDARDAAMQALIRIHPLSSAMVRNRKAQLGFVARRTAHRFLVNTRAEELELRDRLIDYVQHVHDQAIAEKKRATGFLLVVYRKMLASSSHALVVSLTGRLEKLKDLQRLGMKTIKEVQAEEAKDSTLDGDFTLLEGIGIDPALLDWEIEHLEKLIEDAGEVRDSKLETLAHDIVRNILDADPDEKILIFTGFRSTQELIAATLRSMRFRVVIFNGSMTLDQKEAAVREFRDRAQVLVSTEAGGEGRNFQFAHIMVNYDLPWNPMIVEQRIGRLDRIGQDRPVQIYNLALEGTIEEQVLGVLERRIRLFEESIGSLDPILGEIEHDIERLVLEDRDDALNQIEKLGQSLEQRVEQARLAEERLADFIMDESSFRKSATNELLNRRPMATWEDLRRFTELALEHLGGSLGKHELGGDAIGLSPDLTTELAMSRPTLRGAFNPADALAMEEIDFFAFGHEFVDRLIATAAETDAVTGAYIDPTAGPGQWIEILYSVEWDGARPGGKLISHRVDRDLGVLSTEVKTLPEVIPVRTAEVPDWVEEAMSVSADYLARTVDRIHETANEANDAAKEDLLERRRRIHDYQRLRLQEKISVHRDRIERLEAEGTERQQKILPAWRGRLEADLNRSRTLDHDLDRDLAEIKRRTVGVSFQAIAASVVIGQ